VEVISAELLVNIDGQVAEHDGTMSVGKYLASTESGYLARVEETLGALLFCFWDC
jgi:hypothetical protein